MISSKPHHHPARNIKTGMMFRHTEKDRKENILLKIFYPIFTGSILALCIYIANNFKDLADSLFLIYSSFPLSQTQKGTVAATLFLFILNFIIFYMIIVISKTDANSKSKLFIFLVVMMVVFGTSIYALLFDIEPFQNKPLNIESPENGTFPGYYSIIGSYKSNGIISTNKEVEITIKHLFFAIKKDFFPDLIPDNITIQLCIEGNYPTGQLDCGDLIILKRKKDLDDTDYRYINEKNIVFYREFLYAGNKTFFITSSKYLNPKPIPDINIENAFIIEPFRYNE